jgi:hypothetical protein
MAAAVLQVTYSMLQTKSCNSFLQQKKLLLFAQISSYKLDLAVLFLEQEKSMVDS